MSLLVSFQFRLIFQIVPFWIVLAFAVASGVMSCSQLCLRDLKDKKLASKVAVWCGKGHLLGSIVAHCAANCTKYSESVIALAAR